MGDYRNGLCLCISPSLHLSPSVHPSVCPSITLSCPLHISWTLWKSSLNFGQMFASVSQCAEPIIQPCQLKVKVTGQGHRFEPWISCPFHISYTPGRIFFKLWSYVCLSGTICRTHNSTMLTQGQGHSSRSRFEPWILCPLHISYTSGRIFFKLWSNVHLSEAMCRINNSTMPTQGQGHSSRSQVWALNFCISFTPGRIFSKLWSNVHLWDDVQNP